MKKSHTPKGTMAGKTREEILAMIEEARIKREAREKTVGKLFEEMYEIADKIEKSDFENKLKAISREASEQIDNDFAGLVADLQKVNPAILEK